MKNSVTNTTKTNFTKIRSLTLSDIGVIVTNRKQERFDISFAEIEKVYIKKSKLSFVDKAGIASLLIFLLLNSILFLPKELVVISLFIYIPLMVYIENYRLYKLYLVQKSSGLFVQNFNSINKQEHINLVNAIRKEVFDRRFDAAGLFIKDIEPESMTLALDFKLAALSIA